MDAAVILSPAASGGSFLISPNVGLMVWTLLLFGLSMILLWKLAFPRISEALDRRKCAVGLDCLADECVAYRGRTAIEHQTDVSIAQDGGQARFRRADGPGLSSSAI